MLTLLGIAELKEQVTAGRRGNTQCKLTPRMMVLDACGAAACPYGVGFPLKRDIEPEVFSTVFYPDSAFQPIQVFLQLVFPNGQSLSVRGAPACGVPLHIFSALSVCARIDHVQGSIR